MKKSIFITLALTFLITPAWAFMEMAESGDIVGQGQYRVGLIPQAKTSEGSGANISGFFDTGLNEETSVRGWLGSGDTDFLAGGTIKWIPIPDFGNQPAIGGRAGAFFFRQSGDSYSVFRFDPLISKKFDTDLGQLTPYAAVPIMFFSRSSRANTQLQLTLGTEYVHPDVKKIHFGAELGFDLKDSFSYIAAYLSIALDDLNRGQ
jgi:hypothetical protein